MTSTPSNGAGQSVRVNPSRGASKNPYGKRCVTCVLFELMCEEMEQHPGSQMCLFPDNKYQAVGRPRRTR